MRRALLSILGLVLGLSPGWGLADTASAQPVIDAGTPEGGILEPGVLEAGVLEAGVLDAGTLEAGTDTDAGEADAGRPLSENDDVPTEDELPEDLRPEITYRIEPESGIMTGDLVHAILVVRLRSENDDVAIPRQEFGDLELHDQRHSDRRVDGGREFTFELDFLTLEPGEHEIAPITLRVVTESGVIGTVRTEARTITVGSLTANEPDAQPRPATAPVVVMEDDYTLAWVLGILAAMLLSAVGGWLLSRWWRGRPKAAPPPPPPRPPAEVALEKLRELRKKMRKAVELGKEGEIVDGASDALREYLGARYDFNGLESTTDEVVGRLRNARLGPISLNEIIALLGDADLVKFAKAPPDEAQCERMLEGAERIVKGTVPSSTAVTAPAGARIDQTGPNRAMGGTTGAGKKKARDSVPQSSKSMRDEAPDSPPSPNTVAPATTPDGDGELRNADGDRVDELGRRIPDTNPPPPPKEPIATVPGLVVPKPVKTLLGTPDGPEAPELPVEASLPPPRETARETAPETAPETARDTASDATNETTDRATPVGFSDPLAPKAPEAEKSVAENTDAKKPDGSEGPR